MAGIPDFVLGFFWTHFLLLAGGYLFLTEQDVGLRVIYMVMVLVGALLTYDFWRDHLRAWALAGRLRWFFRWTWPRRLMGVATGREYLRWVRTRSGRRPWAVADDRLSGAPSGPSLPHPQGSDAGARLADVATRAGSPEIKRLADLAARTFWGTSVDILTRGLPADTAELLIEALAGVGKCIEAGELPEIERRLEAAAAARSSASTSS